MASILQRRPAWYDSGWFDPSWFQTSQTFTRWEPCWRIRLRLSGAWVGISTRSLSSDPSRAYVGAIREGSEPIVQRSLTDPLYRLQATETLRFGLANAVDPATGVGPYTQAFLDDLRGTPIEAERWDEATHYLLARFTGTISDAWLDDEADSLEIEAKNVKREVLEDLVPKLTITLAHFPDARPEAVGATVRIIMGYAVNVPLFWIRDDLVNSEFHALAPLAVGGGPITINAVKAAAGPALDQSRLLDPSEYTVSTTTYPGFTTIRFPKRQQQWGSSALLTMTCDASCVSTADRNFSRVRQAILTNAQWGLGQATDEASFATAAGQLDAVGGLYCDGVLGEPRSAQDVLRDLGMVRGLMLGLTAAGAWTETVDLPRTPTLVLRDGPGDGVRNLERCTDRRRRPQGERIKRIVFSYRRDDFEGESYRGELTEGTDTEGKDLAIAAPYIRDHGTAQKTLHYLAGRVRWGNETATASALQDVRGADIGVLVTLTYAPQSWSGAVMEVLQVEDRLTTIGLELQGGSQALYNAIYAAPGAPLPGDPSGELVTDYTNTFPAPAQDLTVTSLTIIRDASGLDEARVVCSVTIPVVNCAGFKPRWRPAGTDDWIAAGTLYATGAQTFTLIGPPTGAFVDLSVQTVNQTGSLASTPSSVGEDLLLNVQMAVDATPPTNPTGLLAVAGTGSTVRVTWDAPPEFSASGDYDETYIHRSSVGGGDAEFADVAGTLLARIRATAFVDTAMGQGVQRWYRIRHEDYSGNVTLITSSPTATATPTGTAQGAVPGTPAAPTLSGSGTYLGSDGKTWAYVIVNNPAMPAEGAILNILARADGVTPWTIVAQLAAGGGTTKIDGGVPGLAYEVAAQAFNGFGRASAVSAVLDVVAPGDSTVPADIGAALTLQQTGARVINATPTYTRPVDFKAFRYWISTANNFAGAQQLPDVDGHLVYQGVTAGTTYYVWAKAVDYTGNVSANPSPVASILVRLIQGSAGAGDIDLGNVGVDTPNLKDRATTYPKRQLLAAMSQSYTAVAGGGSSLSAIPHNLGQIPSITVDSGFSSLLGVVAQITTTSMAAAYKSFDSVDRPTTFTAYFW